MSRKQLMVDAGVFIPVGTSRRKLLAWSEAAREAAAAARKANAKGRSNFKGLSDAEKSQFHKDYETAKSKTEGAHFASRQVVAGKGTHQQAADQHEIAAEAHDRAANSAPTEREANRHFKESRHHRDIADMHKRYAQKIG